MLRLERQQFGGKDPAVVDRLIIFPQECRLIDEAMGAEEEADNNVVGDADGEKEYEVEFWIYRNDDYDDDQVTVIAKSEEEALAKAKEENYKGKNFKILKR